MEGAQAMNDVLWAMLIGGIIGLGSSALTALIHGRYSLKSRREENSALEQRHATQIQHERNTQLTSQVIAQRATYLPHVCDALAELHRSVRRIQDKLHTLVSLHLVDMPDILNALARSHPQQSALTEILHKSGVLVKAAQKRQFTEDFGALETDLSGIQACRNRLDEACFRVSDTTLRRLLADLVDKIILCRQVYRLCLLNLSQQQANHDDVTFQFHPISESLSELIVCVAQCNHRMELLLSGAYSLDE